MNLGSESPEVFFCNRIRVIFLQMDFEMKMKGGTAKGGQASVFLNQFSSFTAFSIVNNLRINFLILSVQRFKRFHSYLDHFYFLLLNEPIQWKKL